MPYVLVKTPQWGIWLVYTHEALGPRACILPDPKQWGVLIGL